MPEPETGPAVTEPGAKPSLADVTVAEFRQAGERGDAERAIACLAANVTLISPLTAQFTFSGRDEVANVFRSGFEVISRIRYHTEVGDDWTRALFYHATCGGQALEEAQLLRLDGAGLITEITLFGRPLPGLTAVMTRVVPGILRRQGHPRLGRMLGAGALPMHVMATSAEQRIVPLARPQRPPAGPARKRRFG